MTTFNFYHDPGHGWLEVSKADLDNVGLSEAQISGYSYRKHDRYYLEEDCDASLFELHWRETTSEPLDLREIYIGSRRILGARLDTLRVTT
jgi:hypothetical protein